MTVLGGWGGADVTRVERRGEVWSLVRKVTRPDSGETTRVLLVSSSARISAAQGDSLTSVIRASSYWTHPAQACRKWGIDGYQVILEARVGGEYFTQSCWVPRETDAVMSTMRAFSRLAAAMDRKANPTAP